MSYQAYNVPPPMPTDPTDVAGKRIGAWFIDAVIYVVVSNILSFVFDLSPEVKAFTPEELGSQTPAEFCTQWDLTHSGTCLADAQNVTTIADWQPAVVLFLALAVVFIVYQGILGASLGKLAVGLRIVKADGSLIGIGGSAIRTVLWVVDAFTCGAPILGGILILSTKGHRRVGDMAAGTYVVPATQVGHPVILPGDPGWGTYQQMSQTGGWQGQPGQPVIGPPTGLGGSSSSPSPWAPTPPVGGGPWIADHGTSPAGSNDYEADTPIWEDARQTYIQYDSDRAAWLEYDNRAKEWKPISR